MARHRRLRLGILRTGRDRLFRMLSRTFGCPALTSAIKNGEYFGEFGVHHQQRRLDENPSVVEKAFAPRFGAVANGLQPDNPQQPRSTRRTARKIAKGIFARTTRRTRCRPWFGMAVETLVSAGAVGHWTADAHMCTSCGCVYWFYGSGKIIQGLYDNPDLAALIGAD
jgi:hypothetical protein